jgi:hypothetical protein
MNRRATTKPARRPRSAILHALVLGCAGLPGAALAASFEGLGWLAGSNEGYATYLSADGSSVLGWFYDGDYRIGRWQEAGGSWDLGWSSPDAVSPSGLSADGAAATGNVGVDSPVAGLVGQSIGFAGGGPDPIPPCSHPRRTIDGVSADGTVIVGNARCDLAEPTDPAPQPYRHVASAGVEPLGTQAGFAQSGATGLARSGELVVGWSKSGDGQTFQPFRWTDAAGYEAPPVPLQIRYTSPTTGLHSLFLAADESALAGTNVGALGNEAFLWDALGVAFVGDLPGGADESVARGLSGDGSVVVGQSASASGMEAFAWSRAGDLVPLGDLPGGSFSSVATRVSADGLVYGTGSTDEGLEAFVWDPANGMRRLEDVLALDLGLDLDGWRLESVAGVSDDGRTLAGSGVNPSGQREPWIATVPEPAQALLLLVGAAALAAAGRR